MMTLYRHSRADVSLAVCLSDSFSGRRLVGWCQTPSQLLGVSWTGDQWKNQSGTQTVDAKKLIQVYEACLFDAGGEFRWLRDPQKKALGRAAWITEDPQASPAHFASLPVLHDLSAIDELKTPSGPVPNRCVSQTRARLPGVAMKARAIYRIREYIGDAPEPAGEHGNRVVVARRIIGIETLTLEALL